MQRELIARRAASPATCMHAAHDRTRAHAPQRRRTPCRRPPSKQLHPPPASIACAWRPPRVRASPGRLRSGAHVTQGARPVHRALPSRCRPGHCHERQGHEEHCQHSDPRSNRQRRPSAAGARAPPHHRRTGRRDKRLRHAHHQAHGHNGMVIRISATHVLQTSASRSCLGTCFFLLGTHTFGVPTSFFHPSKTRARVSRTSPR